MQIKVKISTKSFAAIDETKATIRQVLFASFLDLDADLRNTTPFETGYAASSWQIQADGSPALRDGAGGMGRGAPDAGTVAAAIGSTVTFANSAVYIRRLNRGHSKQAPAGWVEACANRLNNHIDKHIMASKRG